MKFKLYFFLLNILVFNFINAQNFYQITYSEKIDFDNVSPVIRYYDLYINNSESLYIENKNLKDYISKHSNKGEVNLTKEKSSNQSTFYLNRNNNDFYINSFINNENNYLVKDIFKHNWNITSETKVILKQKCQKATTTFRGRNYTVWFSTEIKYPYGPWKINNLPGIVLELYDDQNFFTVKAIEIIKNDIDVIPALINELDFSKNISLEEYNIKVEEKNQEILERIRKINPNFKLEKDCETCNKKLEIF